METIGQTLPVVTTQNSETTINNNDSNTALLAEKQNTLAALENSIFALDPQVEDSSLIKTNPNRGFFGVFFDSAAPKYTLHVNIDDEGIPTVKTEDGYKVTFKGEMQEWTITHPDGKITRIWGDPHVVESDGDTWDFNKQTSFVFGDNKITVEVDPLGNGAAYTKTVTIYNGVDRFTLSGINNNKFKFGGWELDAKSHDAKLKDGDVYELNRKNGKESWVKKILKEKV